MPFDSAPDPIAPSSARRRSRGRAAGATGRGAEAAVARRYACAGWREVARNWRPGRLHGGGEIDLILRRGQVLAFVEVKARRTLEQAAHAVSPAQRGRIEAAAIRFAELEEALHLDLRFDVALCDRDGRMEILENAFV
ncbi:MAG: YraN family protein [Pseudomonadota bacterium]